MFQKGVSGNPAGRPRSDVSRKVMAAQKVDERLPMLIAMVYNKAIEQQDMYAAKILLDRWWPAPKLAVVNDVTVENRQPSELHVHFRPAAPTVEAPDGSRLTEVTVTAAIPVAIALSARGVIVRHETTDERMAKVYEMADRIRSGGRL